MWSVLLRLAGKYLISNLVSPYAQNSLQRKNTRFWNSGPITSHRSAQTVIEKDRADRERPGGGSYP